MPRPVRRKLNRWGGRTVSERQFWERSICGGEGGGLSLYIRSGRGNTEARMPLLASSDFHWAAGGPVFSAKQPREMAKEMERGKWKGRPAPLPIWPSSPGGNAPCDTQEPVFSARLENCPAAELMPCLG